MNAFPLPNAKHGDPNLGVESNLDSAHVEEGFVEEREALTRILDSGEFQRSPNLEKILSYLCNQYFQGKSNLVKEYSIATEACNRRADFDPKEDAIVRVEMHRLRKRLREYYDSRGAAEPVRISIPAKSYVPEFEKVNAGMESAAVQKLDLVDESAAMPVVFDISKSLTATPSLELAREEVQASPGTAMYWFAALAVISGLGYTAYKFRPTQNEVVQEQQLIKAVSTADIAAVADPTASISEIRLLAGRPKGRYPDRYGVIWQGDEYFRGGAAVPVEAKVHTRGIDPNLFANMREGDFYYDIPLAQASYELLLFFAETTYGEANSFGGDQSPRSFHILVNNKEAISNFEVMADAHDPNASTAKLLKDVHPDKDGKLHLHFQATSTGKAFLNAMVIRPGIPGKIKPIRIVCRPNGYRDSYNQLWEPDHFYRGGVQITRPTGAALPRDSDLVKGERYGKFAYTIPVPPGKYQARLYFWEYWFGADRPGKGGVESRLFDVFCNFRPLLTNFDILKREPKNQYVVEVFHGLTPNLDSKLIFEFSPKANYALLNAIEIAEDDAVLQSH